MKTKKILAALLSVLMICSICVLPSSATSDSDSSYVITNPYADVDWDNVRQYKTALHTHTNQSDGDPTLFESIERHVEAGFDIVATTDHGTTSYSWKENKENKLIHGALKLVGKSEGDLVALGESGTFKLKTGFASYDYATKQVTGEDTITDVNYTLETINGDDYLKVSNGQVVMRVPYGIENNAVSANAHVNSWFVDYCDNSLTVYDDAIKNVQKKGGVCVINHPGEYSKARYELHAEDAYNTDVWSYRYLVNKFATYLDKYDRCIGVDINSKGDGRTRFDRILWDTLLERFSADGRNVYAICSSDAHQLNKIDTGFTYILMNEQTSKAMSEAMLAGHMIGGSHCNGNPEELRLIAAGIKEYYGETDLYKNIVAMTETMDTRVEEIENGTRDADDDIGDCFDFGLSEYQDGRFVGETQPMINSITVSGDEITIDTTDALIVRWISNGEQIECSKADSATLKLSDCKDKLGDYVRAEVVGEGGILYTEAFLINAADKSSEVVDKGFVDLGFIDCLFPMIKNWKDILSRK